MRHHFIATNWTADSNIFVVFLAKRRYSRCMYGRCKDIYRWIDPLNTSTRLLAVRLFEILVSDPLGAKSAFGQKRDCDETRSYFSSPFGLTPSFLAARGLTVRVGYPSD